MGSEINAGMDSEIGTDMDSEIGTDMATKLGIASMKNPPDGFYRPVYDEPEADEERPDLESQRALE
jgi:hypothetical protein